MRFTILPLLALLPLSLASNLEIDYLTPEITCERKTKNGDKVSMRMYTRCNTSSRRSDQALSAKCPPTYTHTIP